MIGEPYLFPQFGTISTTFTFNGSGGTTSAVTISFMRWLNFVFINIPSVLGTTGTTSNTLISNTALPGWVAPQGANAQSALLVGMKDNATILTTPGRIDVSITGLLTIRRDATGAAWTNAAQAGPNQGTSFVYLIGPGTGA